MIATWFRQGGASMPRSAESLSVDDDGTFHLWRAVGVPAAGRFSGVITADLAGLAAAARSAAAAGDFAMPQQPEGGLETISTGDRRADINAGSNVDGPWSDLIERLRLLADELIDQPVAAVGLSVSADGTSCRIVHLGTEEVQVDAASLRLRADLWEGWYVPAGSWTAPSPVLAGGFNVVAGPGWSVELPFDHGLTLGSDRTLHVAVDVRITVANNPIAAGLRWAPVPRSRS